MAISNILPRKIMKNRTRQQSMAERHDYDQKEEKTDGGELVSSYIVVLQIKRALDLQIILVGK